MAERKATNKYYPPEWDPTKGSINTFRGSHPLRERARKLDQGILIIRFELPFNVWCNGCENHLGMGVRYNAEKSKIGMYYTTPVYQFRMKCHLCDNHFIIKTDPASLDYIVVEGARRQERRWSPTDNEQIDVDKSIKKKLSLDPMFKLEHDVEDKAKATSSKTSLEALESFQHNRWNDDYQSNKTIRTIFRSDKKSLAKIAADDNSLLKRCSLPITMKLNPESSKDVQTAKLLHLQSKHSFEESRLLKRRKIMNQSIFGKNNLFHSKPKSTTIQLSNRETILSSNYLKKHSSLSNVSKRKVKAITSNSTSTKGLSIVNYSSDDNVDDDA